MIKEDFIDWNRELKGSMELVDKGIIWTTRFIDRQDTPIRNWSHAAKVMMAGNLR